MVPASSVKVPRVSTYSGYRCVSSVFAYGAFTLSGRLSQNLSANFNESRPRSEPQHARTLVWALPVSLAATPGITIVFSSSGYLDVSVHRVPFLNRLLVPRHPPYALSCMTNSQRFTCSDGMSFRMFPPWHTGIALPALVLGQFFLFVFFELLG